MRSEEAQGDDVSGLLVDHVAACLTCGDRRSGAVISRFDHGFDHRFDHRDDHRFFLEARSYAET